MTHNTFRQTVAAILATFAFLAAASMAHAAEPVCKKTTETTITTDAHGNTVIRVHTTTTCK